MAGVGGSGGGKMETIVLGQKFKNEKNKKIYKQTLNFSYIVNNFLKIIKRLGPLIILKQQWKNTRMCAMFVND